LKDIGSTTGTFLMVRSEVRLKDQMMFQMGLSEFKVVKTSKSNFIELHVFEGPARQRIVPIDCLGTGIGRDIQNTFCVPEDSQMSNYHAKITYKSDPHAEEGFYLVDVGSTNRTWLRLSPEGDESGWHQMTVGDILKIGSTVFLVQPNDIQGLGNLPVVNKSTDHRGAVSEEEEKANNVLQIDAKDLKRVQCFIEPDSEALEGKNPDLCKLCYESEANGLFQPCNHNFTCYQCAQKCDICPVCRKGFD